MLIAALFPLEVGIGAACAIDTRYPNPLLCQPRLGGNQGKGFNAFKFRTINRAIGELAAWKSFGTFDPRASWVGQTIRQSGLDELPQLLNVLKGDMSLVGTRPLSPHDLERNQAASPQLFDEWFPYFQLVKPGWTGESQLYRHRHRHMTDAVLKKSMELDLRYFNTATLRQDMKLLAITPVATLMANMHIIDNADDVISESAIDLLLPDIQGLPEGTTYPNALS